MLKLGTNRSVLAPKYPAPAETATPVIVSGNSGVDRIFFGDGLQKMFQAVRGVLPGRIGVSSIPGSPWKYRWDDPDAPDAPTAYPDAKLNIGEFDVLHLTNYSGAFNPGANINEDVSYGRKWINHAWANGRGGLGAETLLWSTWATSSGDVVAASQSRIAAYELIQDQSIAACPPGQKIPRVIPGSLVWLRFYRDTVAGTAPSATFYQDLFLPNDNFHQSNNGEYVNMLMFLAGVFGIDPKLCPRQGFGKDVNNVARVPPTEAEVTYIRHVVKDVLAAYPRSGIDTSGWS
ncbi:hypothetical protein [uncultured Sphingomonas sp.]|uniref:hypothetical protein n=1 Tax=uncultured Sphingomonas sp. TaxID=158754 RepID=UPI0025F867F4|nr:hypothetical protein [uncultured Sphingomonas sp.]